MVDDEKTGVEPLGERTISERKATPWYRRGRNLAALGLIAAALAAALFFTVGRGFWTSDSGSSSRTTIQAYFRENKITTSPVGRGDPGAPGVTFALPEGWSDAGPDTPEGAYGAAFYDLSADSDYPSSIVVLLSKLSGDADPAKILEFAPSELQNLTNYRPISDPKTSTMSGFDAVQLGGLYTREDGEERIIAQKTVVIPSGEGLYVLQMNVSGPKEEGAVVQEATAVLDEQAKISP